MSETRQHVRVRPVSGARRGGPGRAEVRGVDELAGLGELLGVGEHTGGADPVALDPAGSAVVRLAGGGAGVGAAPAPAAARRPGGRRQPRRRAAS